MDLTEQSEQIKGRRNFKQWANIGPKKDKTGKKMNFNSAFSLLCFDDKASFCVNAAFIKSFQ